MMAEQEVEHEICGNCKKEIPHYNYEMHKVHCARNLKLCQVCKEPVSKSQYDEHAKTCVEKSKVFRKEKTPELPKTNLENSQYYKVRKEVEDKKQREKREKYLEKYEKLIEPGHSLKQSASKSTTSNTNVKILNTSMKALNVEDSKTESTISPKPLSNGTGAIKKYSYPSRSANPPSKNNKNAGLLPCKYCELEVSSSEIEDHENYCGSRTDKCLDCGAFVMFKHKKLHLDTNHGFQKVEDDLAPKASWDSNISRSDVPANSPPRRRRFNPTIYTNFNQFDPTDYLPSNYRIPKPKIEKGESYKEISRRLDCKTEYIRNLLHDSASITVPLRHNGAVPRNHFNHNKGPAPQPPNRRRNPPTELCIPCEFCDTPIPHEDLIQHETGCRPDLACLKVRRRRQSVDDEEGFLFGPASRAEEDVDLPCEFCAEMIPASQLLRHQSSCG